MRPLTRTILRVLLVRELIKRKAKERVRSVYIRPIFQNRITEGELSLVKELAADPHYYHRYFRMNKANFDAILQKVVHCISHGHNHLRPITALERLAIMIWYLATGNSQMSLAMNYRISPSSVSVIIPEVMEAICEEFGSENVRVPNAEEWQKISQLFCTKWNFPLCCGAIDGKHVRVKAPPHSGTQNFNYKGFFSILLLAVVDAAYKFTLVDIGSSGSNSDGGVFKYSSIGHSFENNKYKLPQNQILPTGAEVQPVILGDDGFPLKQYLMKPYASKSGIVDQNIFNYRLSRARMVVENTFGLWSARWRIFHTCIDGNANLAKLIVRTTIILHNFLMDKNDLNDLTEDRDENGIQMNGNWRDVVIGDTGLIDVERQGSNNASSDAFQIRDNFKNYFTSKEGSLSWQSSYVMRGYE